MNWLLKLFCDHQWKQQYTHSSLSMYDQSGTTEIGEKCSKCQKSRGCVVIRMADGSIEKVFIHKK